MTIRLRTGSSFESRSPDALGGWIEMRYVDRQFRRLARTRAQRIATMQQLQLQLSFWRKVDSTKIPQGKTSFRTSPAVCNELASPPSSPFPDQSRSSPWFRETAPMTPVDNHSRPQSTPHSPSPSPAHGLIT